MNRFFAAIFGAALALSGSAQAAVVEFTTDNLLMEDAQPGGIGLYAPTGTFSFDTDTEAVFDVAVTTPFATYTSGIFVSGVIDAFLFQNATSTFMLDVEVFEDIAALVAGLSIGDGVFLGAQSYEFSAGTVDSFPIDPSLSGTIIALNTPPPVPLPAGLPLLLLGLGGLVLLRRRS